MNRLAILLFLALAATAAAQTESILLASDDFPNRFFGDAVALDGDLAVIGADADDTAGLNSGAVYVFRNTGLAWLETEKIVPADLGAQDQFGGAIAVQGDLVVVGASHQDDATHGVNTGAVYVYRDNGSTLVFEQKLLASNIGAGVQFGLDVAVDGDTIVVGSFSGAALFTGAAYVFEYDGTSWSETQMLVGTGTGVYDAFSVGLGLDGDWLAIGASSKDEAFSNSGAVYMYWHDGTSWNEVQKLTPADAGQDDYFGLLDLDGNALAVSAVEHEDGTADNTGALFVFRESGGVWIEEQKLTASNAQDMDSLGRSISIDGDMIVAGALTDTTAINAGSAYVFEFDGTSWSESLEIAPSDFSVGDGFALSLMTDGANIIVGAPYVDKPNSGMNSGKAYVYSWPGSTNYPGTPDDFDLRSAVNGPVNGVDVKTLTPGDDLTLDLRSPNGSLDTAQFYLLAQAFPTATPPTPVFDFWFDLGQPVTVLFDSNATPFGAVGLPAGGFGMTFSVPSTIPGVSVMAQGLSISSAATNGFYATTGAHELRMP